VARSKQETSAYKLISEYTRLYKEKYSTAPMINKYREKWGMLSLVEDFDEDPVSKTLQYYFTLNKEGHSLPWFYNNFVSVHSSRLASEKDAIVRAAQRRKTAELRAEYLNGIQ